MLEITKEAHVVDTLNAAPVAMIHHFGIHLSMPDFTDDDFYSHAPLMHSSAVSFFESSRTSIPLLTDGPFACIGSTKDHQDQMNEIAFCEAVKIDANLQYVMDKKQKDHLSNTISLVHALFEEILKSKSVLEMCLPYPNNVDDEKGGEDDYDPFLDTYNSTKYLQYIAGLGQFTAGGKTGELPPSLKLMSGWCLLLNRLFIKNFSGICMEINKEVSRRMKK